MSNSQQKSNKKPKRKKKKQRFNILHSAFTHSMYSIFKFPLIGFSMLFYNIRYKRNGYKIPKGPVLFLSNHSSNPDGLWVMGLALSKTIFFVVNEELFANKFFRIFTSGVAQFIKRSTSLNDVGHIRELRRYVKQGRSVGIFPAGDIGMFGESLPVDESIAKLAKMLDVPIVTTKITGAALRAQRTIKKMRRSKITYHITDVISVEDVRSLTNESLHERIVQGIEHNEPEWQKEQMIKLKTKRKLAEHYELGLFLCPKCGHYETLKSNNNDINCLNCDFKVTVNRYDQLDYYEVNPTYPTFINANDWDKWQLEKLKEKIDNWDDHNTPIAYRENLYYNEVKKDEIFQPYSEKNAKACSFAIFLDKIVLTSDKGEIIHELYFENSDIYRILVQYKDVYELDFGEYRLRVFSKQKDFPAHMYIEASRHLLHKNNVIISTR